MIHLRTHLELFVHTAIETITHLWAVFRFPEDSSDLCGTNCEDDVAAF
jgi:hypothetical protein